MPDGLECRIPAVRVVACFPATPGADEQAQFASLLSERWFRIRSMSRPADAGEAWPAPPGNTGTMLAAECVPYTIPRARLAAQLETLIRLRRLVSAAGACGFAGDLYATDLRQITVPFPGGPLPAPLDPATARIEFVPARSDRSEVFRLEDAGGACCYAKIFARDNETGLARECEAREILTDLPLARIVHRGPRTLWIKGEKDYRSWRPGVFTFYPRAAARAAFDFLGACARRGYAMVDVGPLMFLYRRDGRIIAIDFEFLTRARRARGYRDSADFSGELVGRHFKHEGGFDVHWSDPLGASYETIVSGSDMALLFSRLRHLATRRLPRRARDGITWSWRALLALGFAAARRRQGGYRLVAENARARPASRNADTGETPRRGSHRPSARPRRTA